LARNPTDAERAAGGQFFAAAAKQPAAVPAWQYGYGGVDDATGKVTFTHLPHWGGSVWQGGPKMPDPRFSYTSLRPTGGHPGNGPQLATVLRWTSPADAVVELRGTLKHDAPAGDGVRARAVTRGGVLKEWIADKRSVGTHLPRIEVRQGETIDLVVDCRGGTNHDSYSWSPELVQVEPVAGPMWKSDKQFHGPVDLPDAWELYAQVLLLTNEFVFVD
jgi:hypothetical protein